MACKPFITTTDSGQRITGFICGPRGRKPKKCAYCSRPSTKLCDFPVALPGESPSAPGMPAMGTCDKPICGQCARHTEPDTDVCRVHPAK